MWAGAKPPGQQGLSPVVHTATHFCHLGKSQDSRVQLWSSSSQFSDKDIVLPPQPRVRVVLQPCSAQARLTLQVREPQPEARPCPPSHPQPTWAAGSSSHLVSHGCHQAVRWEWSSSTSGRDQGVPEKAWTTSPSLFQASQQLNSAAQTSPVLGSQLPGSAGLPGMHLRPAAPSPVSPRT